MTVKSIVVSCFMIFVLRVEIVTGGTNDYGQLGLGNADRYQVDLP